MTKGTIPQNYHTLSPHIIVRDAKKAIHFYTTVFEATELERRIGPDGKMIIYAALQIGDSRLMISEEFPGNPASANPLPNAVPPITIHFWTTDVDAIIARAKDQGAVILMEPSIQFWGDYYGMFIDPFHHRWSIATRIQTLTSEEIDAAAAKAFSSMKK